MFLPPGVGAASMGHLSSRQPAFSGLLGARFFKDVDELAIPPCNLANRGLARSCFRPPSDERFPEVGAPNGEPDEARHSSRNCQPFAHLFVVLSPAQNDATNFVPTPVTGSRHNALAILPAIETFDLPDVGFDVRILKLFYGVDH